VEIFREMAMNDPTVSAMLFTIDRLIRNVDWPVKPAGKTPEDEAAAKFVESCMTDMSQSWGDFISEALSCVTYGWSWHEVVFKRRVGPWEADPRKKSKYTDGLVGIRKLPIRSQDTLLRWLFDEAGETRGMVQIAPPIYATKTLPIERSLLFRYRHYKGSPEGISMLRGAYRPWFFKKRLEEFEAIGVERDLAGLPIVRAPTRPSPSRRSRSWSSRCGATSRRAWSSRRPTTRRPSSRCTTCPCSVAAARARSTPTRSSSATSSGS
jgi:hypothetical protein